MIINYNKRELEISFEHLTAGLRVWVFEWYDNGAQWVLRSNDLYPLTTEFEALCSIASDLFGDSVHGESLAELLGVEMRSSDDAPCIKCGAYQHYEEMIHGSDAHDTVAEKLGLTNWDYVCADCYFPIYWTVEEKVL
jgi:hypothetical protein